MTKVMLRRRKAEKPPITDESGEYFDLTGLARAAYESYGQHTEWKNFRGEAMPAWDDLPKQIRGAWRAAAGRMVSEVDNCRIGPAMDGVSIKLPDEVTEIQMMYGVWIRKCEDDDAVYWVVSSTRSEATRSFLGPIEALTAAMELVEINREIVVAEIKAAQWLKGSK